LHVVLVYAKAQLRMLTFLFILNLIHNLLFAVFASLLREIQILLVASLLLCKIQIVLLLGWGGKTFTNIFEEKNIATCAICCPKHRHIKLELALLSLIVVDFADLRTRNIVNSSPLFDFITLRVRVVRLANAVEDYWRGNLRVLLLFDAN